ncbi:hypothetical protein ACFCXH_39610, partial [Streptomyces nojiriensis]
MSYAPDGQQYQPYRPEGQIPQPPHGDQYGRPYGQQPPPGRPQQPYGQQDRYGQQPQYAPQDQYEQTARYGPQDLLPEEPPRRRKGRRWLIAGASVLALAGIAALVLNHYEIPPFTDKGSSVSFGQTPAGGGKKNDAPPPPN